MLYKIKLASPSDPASLILCSSSWKTYDSLSIYAAFETTVALSLLNSEEVPVIFSLKVIVPENTNVLLWKQKSFLSYLSAPVLCF